jgi:DNA-3-methyladenine glycosylase I
MTQAPDRAVPEGLRLHADGLLRCWWCGDDPDYVAYHDREWGRAVHDEGRLFEKLCLEGFQAGLSWLTILRKRPAFRAAFAGFDPEVVATYGDSEVERLLEDAGIVRSRAKIEATITNARALLRLRAAGGNLAELVWAFAPTGDPRPRPRSLAEVAAVTPASTTLARELKSVGFRFVGPTTAYAFMQAMGLVDDHLDGCHVPPAVSSRP